MKGPEEGAPPVHWEKLLEGMGPARVEEDLSGKVHAFIEDGLCDLLYLPVLGGHGHDVGRLDDPADIERIEAVFADVPFRGIERGQSASRQRQRS